MPQSQPSVIAELPIDAAGDAALKSLRWEQAVEFVGAVVGLGCIVIGGTMFLLGTGGLAP